MRADVATVGHRWPEFAAAATTAGIGTVLSCPLFVPAGGTSSHRHEEEDVLSGSLNVWSTRPGAFDPIETALIAMFTSAVSMVILTAHRWARAHAKVGQLRAALDTRDTIATAKGIIMVRHGLDADGAFRWLVDASQRTNRKVHDVARTITENLDLAGTAPSPL